MGALLKGTGLPANDNELATKIESGNNHGKYKEDDQELEEEEVREELMQIVLMHFNAVCKLISVCIPLYTLRASI